MIDAKELDRLSELEAKATAKPWKHYPQVHKGDDVSIEFRSDGTPETDGDYGGLTVNGRWFDGCKECVVDPADGDCKFIAALRNAAPALIQAAREAIRLREDNARLEQKINRMAKALRIFSPCWVDDGIDPHTPAACPGEDETT